ncbi:hypothetical protein [Luteibacter sp.]|uniref:tetratricopeptide repeat protein n=1 Tax=Luteibacter sp. TaxID=1886636 RepID=UPI0028075C12|nr:hypothetical protein [Luteibacter sp.]MDQ8051338.1 hypothetical protein [Luteibacter sp.]
MVLILGAIGAAGTLPYHRLHPLLHRHPMEDQASELSFDELYDRAYAAWDRGELKDASNGFAELLRREPDNPNFHYMQGLAHKYLRDWRTSLHHNLRSQALREEKCESSLWNAGIAATALGDWAQARHSWAACGIKVPDGDGPVDADFGVVSIRLNPWGRGETLFARRIDIVRARLLNVPLPESGYQFGDIVLHDGAQTGSRFDGEVKVPVFNAMARLAPSEFKTFTAFVSCDDKAGIEELLSSSAPGVAYIEDWTDSVQYYCLRCSYNVPHRHATTDEAGSWEPDRNLGFAAQSRQLVEALLARWVRSGEGRSLDGIEFKEVAETEPEDGQVWWQEPSFDEDK